jgi:enamine deaminase RidA (YjgF/YER057c/UK114 family)
MFGGNKVFEAFRYNPAVRAGGLLFVAGQVGIRDDGTVPDDAPAQIDLAFRRLGAILAHEGLGFADLVEMTSYHVRIDEQLAAFREIKDRYVTADFPAWTIIGVAALARPNLLVEIKAVAALRG